MASAPSKRTQFDKKGVSRFKGDAELKSPIRATIVEGHNLNKKSLKHVSESLKGSYLNDIIKIVKDNIGLIMNDDVDDADDSSKLDKESSNPKKVDLKLIEKQISNIYDSFVNKLYSKFIPHLEKNRSNLMLKIFHLQHSHAMNSLIDEVTENDITMINDYLEDDEKLIDKYEHAEELEERQKMEMFQQLLGGGGDDEDESINIPSFMSGLGSDDGLYNGMDSDTPVCDSDGDNDGDDDPPINYEEYFNRFLNNGLGDELNLDDPDDNDVENDDDVDDEETHSIDGCQSGCDCVDSCSIKTKDTKHTKHTKEDLEKLKLTDIKSIAKSYDISMKRSKKSKTKAQLINEIIKNEK